MFYSLIIPCFFIYYTRYVYDIYTINCEPPCIYVPLVESRYGLQLQLVGETSGCSYNRRPPPHSRRE